MLVATLNIHKHLYFNPAWLFFWKIEGSSRLLFYTLLISTHKTQCCGWLKLHVVIILTVVVKILTSEPRTWLKQKSGNLTLHGDSREGLHSRTKQLLF